MSEEEFKGIEIEEEEEIEKELDMARFLNNFLSTDSSKPGIQIEFETEDQLKNFMHKLTDTGLLAEGTLAFVQNVSEDFFKGFENISSVTDSEYDNDDLSD